MPSVPITPPMYSLKREEVCRMIIAVLPSGSYLSGGCVMTSTRSINPASYPLRRPAISEASTRCKTLPILTKTCSLPMMPSWLPLTCTFGICLSKSKASLLRSLISRTSTVKPSGCVRTPTICPRTTTVCSSSALVSRVMVPRSSDSAVRLISSVCIA